MVSKRKKFTLHLDEETDRLLERIAQDELRKKGPTITFLIRQEAAKRGMINRAPAAIATAKSG